MKLESNAEAWLNALEALEPEPLDSGQRKRHLKWEGERLRSMLRKARQDRWALSTQHQPEGPSLDAFSSKNANRFDKLRPSSSARAWRV